MRARAGLIGIALAALAGCDLMFPPGTLGRDGPPGPDDHDADVGDGAMPDASLTGPFKFPVKVLLGQALPEFASDPTLTGDEKRLTYVVGAIGSQNTSIWTGMRGSGPTEWTGGFQEPFNNQPAAPKISEDGLTIGFIVTVLTPNFDIRSRRRPAVTEPWVVSTDYDGLNSGIDDRLSTPALDTLRVIRYRRDHAMAGTPGFLTEMQRISPSTAWTVVADSLDEVEAAQPNWHKHSPYLSPDGLVLIYAGATSLAAQADLYIAKRASIDAKFAAPVPIAELNDPELNDSDPWLSADGVRIYFARTSNAGTRTDEWGIYFSERSAP